MVTHNDTAGYLGLMQNLQECGTFQINTRRFHDSRSHRKAKPCTFQINLVVIMTHDNNTDDDNS